MLGKNCLTQIDADLLDTTHDTIDEVIIRRQRLGIGYSARFQVEHRDISKCSTSVDGEYQRHSEAVPLFSEISK